MKSSNKDKAKSFLGNVPEDKVFWLNDGRSLKNILELAAALKDMGNDIFCYHANDDKNDFKNWIEFVILDKRLAEDISKIRSKELMLKKINKRISQLTLQAK